MPYENGIMILNKNLVKVRRYISSRIIFYKEKDFTILDHHKQSFCLPLWLFQQKLKPSHKSSKCSSYKT